MNLVLGEHDRKDAENLKQLEIIIWVERTLAQAGSFCIYTVQKKI